MLERRFRSQGCLGLFLSRRDCSQLAWGRVSRTPGNFLNITVVALSVTKQSLDRRICQITSDAVCKNRPTLPHLLLTRSNVPSVPNLCKVRAAGLSMLNVKQESVPIRCLSGASVVARPLWGELFNGGDHETYCRRDCVIGRAGWLC